MFSFFTKLPIFIQVLLLIAALSILAATIIISRKVGNRRRNEKTDGDPSLTFLFGKENDDFSKEKSSVLKEIPQRIWQDLSHFVANLFKPNQYSDTEGDSAYSNEEERKMLEKVQQEEGSAYSMPEEIEQKTEVVETVAPDAENEEKTDDNPSDFKEYTRLETENNVQFDLETARNDYIEARKAAKKRKKQRKMPVGESTLSDEEASLTISMLQDLIIDCEDLDKSKIKGRLEFLKKNIKK